MIRSAISPSKPKKRTCANRACRNKFEPDPRHPFVTACCEGCKIILMKQHIQKAEAARERKARREAKAQRMADKEKLDSLKRRADWLAEAQTAFNAFIRARDAGKPCICCGKPFEPQRPGGSVDAGHYRSRGSSPHLRFDERNVHAQRKNCNRPGGAKHDAFRAGMEARIGLEALEALESDQESRDWTIDDLKQIKATYRAKTKALLDKGVA